MNLSNEYDHADRKILRDRDPAPSMKSFRITARHAGRRRTRTRSLDRRRRRRQFVSTTRLIW